MTLLNNLTDVTLHGENLLICFTQTIDYTNGCRQTIKHHFAQPTSSSHCVYESLKTLTTHSERG